MSPYSSPALLALAINISLIVIVLLDNYRSHPHRLFALLIACFILWDVGDILVVNSTSLDQASVGGGIIVTALIFATTFFLNISFVFPRTVRSNLNQAWIQAVSFSLAFAFSILCALGVVQPLTITYLGNRQFYSYALTDSLAPSGAVLFLTIFAYLSIGAANLVKQLRSARFHRERMQIKFFLYGTLVYALLIFVLDLLHDYEVVHFYASRVLFLIISFFLAYVVLANRLLVVHKILKHGVVYSIVAGVMFGFYVIAVQGIARGIKAYLGTSSLPIEIFIILILSFLFWPLSNAVQTLLDHLFYQHLFRYRDKFILFTREVFNLTDGIELGRSVHAFLKDALQATSSQMMLYDDDDGVTLRSILDPSVTLPSGGTIAALIMNERRPFEIGELLEDCSEKERTLLQRADRGVLVGLYGKRGMIGFILIGPPGDGKPYSLDEMQFLTIFSNEVSMAIERNTMMQRMKAEEMKSIQMEKLAAMGRLTAGIAHQFRNPLSIIKTSAQTILRNVDNGVVVQETGTFIVSEVERLDSIVGTFLRFAKPHTPVWEPCELSGLLERVIRSLEQKAAASGVQLRSEMTDEVPEIVTSSRHVEQALVNLGMNAIEAMPTGGTLVMSATIKGTMKVQISVRDTGPGIAPDLQKRLFDPFFTTKSAGTGLGLSIAYMMIQNIKGSLSFTSNSTGTTFFIELPINGAE